MIPQEAMPCSPSWVCPQLLICSIETLTLGKMLLTPTTRLQTCAGSSVLLWVTLTNCGTSSASDAPVALPWNIEKAMNSGEQRKRGFRFENQQTFPTLAAPWIVELLRSKGGKCQAYQAALNSWGLCTPRTMHPKVSPGCISRIPPRLTPILRRNKEGGRSPFLLIPPATPLLQWWRLRWF